ncbi:MULTISPECIES: hypothetical protein [Clostridium]|uniref:Uncharacterized protein n=1 Tax=Clostridium sporogenes TaxID=1509 RepID=A0A7U4JM73_CLOSG|nr:hypothetical protein [Clostridium sporogenes]STC74695.1 Uncharacterised protein [Clostridium botulinum]AKC61727.1 hypothetical protein CLSPO_c10070 [Clostridium sporogenes]KCZ69034.1 hypothetical protein CSPO_4c05590 [Clostridium sporogenes]MCW6085340.1 hypothetical protein [Clostridium sporogenes]MDS1008290.1 hypothetical protein [Clostridium sporogenes]
MSQDYEKPELGTVSPEQRFSPVAVAALYIYVGALTTVVAETVAVVHAGAVAWTGVVVK